MKVLFIANGRFFTDDEMNHLDRKNVKGFERVSASAFIFDVTKSAALLADLQNFCHGTGVTYKLFYFDKEPVIFTSP